MFESNLLTFNPGWDQNTLPIDNFEDIRKIQKDLKQGGIEVDSFLKIIQFFLTSMYNIKANNCHVIF